MTFRIDNKVMDTVRRCMMQFEFYAREHRVQGKIEKAATNQAFADECRAILDTPLSDEDHEHIHVVHNADGTTSIQHYGEAHVIPNSYQTVFVVPPGVTDYVITRRKV